MDHVGANTRDNRVITTMTLLALRLRCRVGNLSLAGKGHRGHHRHQFYAPPREARAGYE